MNKFYDDIKNVLTKEKLKEYLKLPIYSYIISFVLGMVIVIIISVFKPDEIQGASFNPEKLAGLKISMTWLDIITNNIKVLFTLFISGIVLYIGPVFFIGLNGFLQGFLLALFVQAKGAIGLVTYFVLLVPHGIFELPALFLGAGAGIILSKELVNLITVRWMNKSKLYEAFLLLFVAFCLLIVASVVESQLTFRILRIISTIPPMS